MSKLLDFITSNYLAEDDDGDVDDMPTYPDPNRPGFRADWSVMEAEIASAIEEKQATLHVSNHADRKGHYDQEFSVSLGLFVLEPLHTAPTRIIMGSEETDILPICVPKHILMYPVRLGTGYFFKTTKGSFLITLR